MVNMTLQEVAKCKYVQVLAQKILHCLLFVKLSVFILVFLLICPFQHIRQTACHLKPKVLICWLELTQH